MLFSFNKLKELAALPANIKIEEVNQAINSIGFEVEQFRPFSDVKGIKFAKVLETYKNPQGDKLTVCRLQFDDGERIIQTTATNVEPNTVVIAFVPGSSVNGATFIAKSLKGIVSEGMLSSPGEFGIDRNLVREANNSGIYAYENVKDISLDPISYLGLDDYIIEVKILSNRADANSYFAMALELAGYFGTSVKLPKRHKPSFVTDIEVENGKAKSLAMVEGKRDFTIDIRDQILLAKSNVKSIDDIVDLTNLTLLMTGQPTHAYDKAKVGKKFKAEIKSGKVKIFGDKEVALDKDLAITSDHEIVSVAGVIGIENKGVSENTSDFILEFGRFFPKDIRKAAKVVKLSTMASNQSAKEFSPFITKWALDYVSIVVHSLSNVVNEPEVVEKEVAFDPKQVAFLAGKDITKEKRYLKALKALETIGYEFKKDSVKVAPHIFGIDAQQDLNEEIFRFYGYDEFAPEPPVIVASPIFKVELLHDKMAAQGYQEVNTYLLTAKDKNQFNPFEFARSVTLETFVSKEREQIRDSMVPALLENVLYNQKRKIGKVSLFDIGMVNSGQKTLGMASTVKSFNEMVKDLQNILGPNLELRRFASSEVHTGVSARIYLQGEMIGWIGKLHPSNDETDAFVAEVKLIEPQGKIAYKEYSSEPLKQRDITIGIGLKEDSAATRAKLAKFNVFAIELVAKFVKNNQNFVTFRVLASEEVAAAIDKEFS